MRWLLVRPLVRFLIVFARGLWQGEPWAWATLAGLCAMAALWGFVRFARRPLGGDPEKMPTDDERFLDEKNPYRDLS